MSYVCKNVLELCSLFFGTISTVCHGWGLRCSLHFESPGSQTIIELLDGLRPWTRGSVSLGKFLLDRLGLGLLQHSNSEKVQIDVPLPFYWAGEKQIQYMHVYSENKSTLFNIIHASRMQATPWKSQVKISMVIMLSFHIFLMAPVFHAHVPPMSPCPNWMFVNPKP